MADISRITIGEITYDIKDSVARSQGGSAANVSYDNTDSGLTATNAQDAIDELNTKIYDAGNYETVSLTIGSADSTFSPVGQTITVTLEDGSSTDYVLTNSLVISFSVQKGVRYTISGTSTADYRILPVSYVATLQTRLITMRYIPIATGVFILQSDGNYYLREEYDAETMAEDAVGVLVLTSALINAKFGIVIKKNTPFKTFTSATHPGARGYTEQLYNGYKTTQTMVSNNDNIAIYCMGQSIQMDEGELTGFIPSQVEGKQVSSNMTEVNNCLRLISGTLLSDGNDYITVNWYGNQCCGWVTMQSVTSRSKCCPVFYFPIV